MIQVNAKQKIQTSITEENQLKLDIIQEDGSSIKTIYLKVNELGDLIANLDEKFVEIINKEQPNLNLKNKKNG